VGIRPAAHSLPSQRAASSSTGSNEASSHECCAVTYSSGATRTRQLLHHGQVLGRVVRVEGEPALVQLQDNAADAPHVAGERPVHPEDHLRRSAAACEQSTVCACGME
jgi:hypothetical protein